MRNGFGYRAMPAPYALPAAFAMFLTLGTVAAALHGRLPATGVLIACAAIALVMSFAAEPVAAVFLAGIGWLTAAGFSRPPYAQLRPTGPAAVRPHLDLADDLLIYLVAVVTITVVGGFWPAVLAAVAASLLLNWYFTEPLHTFTIAEPKNLLALLLFVTVAVAVSSMVHLAA